jgi:hypothetical protein
VAIPPQEITPPNLAKLRLQCVGCVSHEGREMSRVAPLLKRRESETYHPRRHDGYSEQRNIEHAAERNQLTPKAEQQLRRWKWLQLFCGDMSDVPEGGACCRGIRAVD